MAIVKEELEQNLPACLLRYAKNPVEFAKDVLRVEPLQWQSEFMQAVANARMGKPNSQDELTKMRFAIRSGTGVGKTASVAMLTLWHLACFTDSKIAVTAPTAPQIKAVMWPELKRWISNIPSELKIIFPYDATGDQIRLYENFAVARTAREESPESFQGLHSKNIMLIADEASGVPHAVYMAGQGVMSSEGAITIMIGNPTRAVGYFFDAFHGDSHLYWTKRVGCDMSPMVSPAYLKDMKKKHGENSYEYQVRVLGNFFLEDTSIIIPRPWIDEAVERDVTPDSDYIVWGVDVSDGRDKSALSKRKGNILMDKPKSWGGKDIMASVGIVADEYFGCKRGEEPDEICVDAIGMGTAFAGRLAEVLKGEPVKITRVNVALTGAKIGERFTSRRVELWAHGRAWFESALTRIPKGCETLAAQLSSVEWEVKDSNGKWTIIDKKAGGSSPDEADSFLLTFGGVKGAKSSFTKNKGTRKLFGAKSDQEYGITSASYL